jgi:hypothetical protein
MLNLQEIPITVVARGHGKFKPKDAARKSEPSGTKPSVGDDFNDESAFLGAHFRC